MQPGRRLLNWVTSGYALRTSVDKNLPTEYASTTNTSIRYQKHLADPTSRSWTSAIHDRLSFGCTSIESRRRSLPQNQIHTTYLRHQ
jgi:hypothetical protein